MTVTLLPESPPLDTALWQDFQALCDTGGRQAGTSSEAAALLWARARLAEIGGGKVQTVDTPYAGWHCVSASLALANGQAGDVQALLASPPTPKEGLALEVVDCGRGTPDDFARVGDRVRGKAALVRHEYMFATETIHRRVKLRAAIEAGAKGFLIAAPAHGQGPVSGSSGFSGEPGSGIPALGISAETADAILATPEGKVRFFIDAVAEPGKPTEALILDLPGRTDDYIVVSAHLDGHIQAESALDNASGVVLALALARQVAPYVGALERGVRICLFSAEEWALTGSKVWLEAMPESDRRKMLLDINLDTIVGGKHLTALTSEFPSLGAFVQNAAAQVGIELGVHLPFMSNSDHANFANHGIPAFRLVSGFNERDSAVRLVLTRHDLRDLVQEAEFDAPWRATWAILREALLAPRDRLIPLARR